MELQLTRQEHETLLEFLRERHRHLLHEIAKTDHHEFRATLRHRCTELEHIIEKLEQPVHALA